MKSLTILSSPRPRLPVAFRIVLLAAGARVLFQRLKRPRPASGDLDFSDLAADAPNWIAQLTERDD
ncbi:MAG TPA: hypothetical protein VK002_12865 [Rubricoccaceae bacterium]|nr:hypothetical protein [Rubricoccaceae bacterium]